MPSAEILDQIIDNVGKGKGITILGTKDPLDSLIPGLKERVNAIPCSTRLKPPDTDITALWLADPKVENPGTLAHLIHHWLLPAYQRGWAVFMWTPRTQESFNSDRLKRRREEWFLDTQRMYREQFWWLVEQQSVVFNQPDDLLNQLVYYWPETPIERLMREELQKQGIPYQRQVKVGRYWVDFLMGDGQLAVECDGRLYHEPSRDSQRDKELSTLGIKQVLHFTGSQIFGDVTSCVERIGEALDDLDTFRVAFHRYPRPSRWPKPDESQEAALQNLHGVAMVLAPAGSGIPPAR